MRPLALEDLFTLRRLGDPQLSPDGAQVVYVEQYVDPQTLAGRSVLWLVAADGGLPPRQLTDEGARDHCPRWSPDGRRIAFLSDRSGSVQVWLLTPESGTLTQLTEGAAEPTASLAWSPTGSHVALSAWTRLHERDEVPYPGAPAPSQDRAPAEKDRPRVITRYDHKQDGAGHYGARFRQLFTCVVGDTPTAPSPLFGMEAHCDHPCWAPDGRHLAYVVTGAQDRHFFAGSELWLGDPLSSETRSLWRPGGQITSGPAWSGDGARIGIVAEDAAHGSYTTTDGLWEVTVATGVGVNLTASFDREVGEAISADWRHGGHTGPTWTPQGWIFLARSHGRSQVYRAPKEPLTEGPMAVAGYSFAGGRLAYQASASDSPDLISVDQRVVARPGGPWTEIKLSSARRFDFAGEGGLPMEGWVLMPDQPGPHPAVLAIHGGPHNVYGESLHLLFQALVTAGYAVVYLNPRGSQSYGQEFAAAVRGDWGGADYHDLMRGLDAAIALGGIDPARLAVTGWSYGGFMTNRIITQTGRFKAAVSGACISNLHSYYGTSDIGAPFLNIQAPGLPWEEPRRLLEHSPLQRVEQVQTPVLLLHGESDLRCPLSQSEEFYVALKQLNRTAVLVTYPDEPHGFKQAVHIYDRYRRTIAWFDHYLLGR